MTCLAVYEPLSGTEANGYNYGTSLNRPYEVEKPPSAQISQPEVYVPPAIAPSVSNPFPVADTGMVSTYAPQYQTLQESPSHTMAPRNSGHDSVVYPVDVSTSVYYPDASVIPGGDPINFPNLGNTDRHIPTREGMPGPYDDNMMGMAVTCAVSPTSSIPARATSFALAPTYAMPCVKTEDADMSAHSNSLDVVFPHQRPPASKRGPFKDQKAREETAVTRKNGSCIRCKMQRVRVSGVELPVDRAHLCTVTDEISVKLTQTTRRVHVLGASRKRPTITTSNSSDSHACVARSQNATSSREARRLAMNGHGAGATAS